MADNEKTTLATFNVGSDDWESFKTLAKKDGRPASYYLNQFIKQSISRGSFEPVIIESKPISDIDLSGVESLVNESVKSAIAELSIPIDSLINKDQLGSVIADLRKEFSWIDETIKQLQTEHEQLKKEEPIG